MSLKILLITAVYLDVFCWWPLSNCIAYQYFFLDPNGDYRYEYQTENGIYARQVGDSNNQVAGQYSYGDNGRSYDLKYTAGVQGYVPDYVNYNQFTNLGYLAPGQAQRPRNNFPDQSYVKPSISTYKQPQVAFTLGGQLGISGQLDLPYGSDGNYNDARIFGLSPSDKYIPYNFAFNTGNHQREEARDGQGNTQGYFSYTDDAGLHDLRYIANEKDGFKVIGGNLALYAVPSNTQSTQFTVGKYSDGKIEEISKQREDDSSEEDVPFYKGITESPELAQS